METLTPVELTPKLLAKGVRPIDVSSALLLRAGIEQLDKLVFPQNPCRVRISHRKSKGGYEATYRSSPVELFTIFAPGLDKRFRKDRKGAFLFVEEDGEMKLWSNKNIGLWEIIISLAAHEVRHRIQHHLKPSFFTFEPELKQNIDLLTAVRHIVKLLFDEMKKRYKRERQKKTYIRARVNSKEVDASVVEVMALQLVHHNPSLEVLVPLLRSGVTQTA